jgi:bifunctional DNA-binding transcriptional regulator/antitoxin component of YhaV-PrlF toxin-antitoxin module
MEGTMEQMETTELRARTRLGEKGRFVIPAAMRQALGVDVGGVLDLRLIDGELRISSIRSRIQRVQARARQIIPPGVSIADELSAERREAAKHE